MTAVGEVGAVLIAVSLILAAVVLVFDRRRIRRVSARLTLTIDREPRNPPIRRNTTGDDMETPENSPLPAEGPERRSPGPDPEPAPPDQTTPPEEPGGPSTPEEDDGDVSPSVVHVTESVEYDVAPESPAEESDG